MKPFITPLLAAMVLCLASCGTSSTDPVPTSVPTTPVATVPHAPAEIYYSTTAYEYFLVHIVGTGGNSETSVVTDLYEDGVKVQSLPINNLKPGDELEQRFYIHNTRSEATTYPGPWKEYHKYRIVVPGSLDLTFTVTYVVRMVSIG